MSQGQQTRLDKMGQELRQGDEVFIRALVGHFFCGDDVHLNVPCFDKEGRPITRHFSLAADCMTKVQPLQPAPT